MTHSVAVDRFEGEGKSLAVLVTDDGDQIVLPRGMLPVGTKPGDVLTVRFEVDATATRKTAEKTREVEAELKAKDPGGDIRL